MRRVFLAFLVILTAFAPGPASPGGSTVNEANSSRKVALMDCDNMIMDCDNSQLPRQHAPVATALPAQAVLPAMTISPAEADVILPAETDAVLRANRGGGPEVPIRLSFAGDCTLGTDEAFSYINSFPYRLKEQDDDYSYFFRKVKPVFENDDITLVNLETTLTDAVKPAEKKFRFKGPPSYARILTEGDIEVVNIANNHIYDYMEKGYRDTLDTLDRSGIAYCGEGHVARQNVKGIRVSFLGYPGWDTAMKKRLSEEITAERGNADIVVVSFHWGEERKHYPNETQKELARYSIDLGADVVVGHHPHVLQGIEKYRDRFIVYSLGNFCFGGNRNPGDKDTIIFCLEYTSVNGAITGYAARIIPCRISSTENINDYQPCILTGKDRERVLKRIEEYSKALEYGISLHDCLP